MRPCGSFETLKVKLKLEIVYAVSIVLNGTFFTYIHIDFKQAGYNLRICITKYKWLVFGYGQKMNQPIKG